MSTNAFSCRVVTSCHITSGKFSGPAEFKQSVTEQKFEILVLKRGLCQEAAPKCLLPCMEGASYWWCGLPKQSIFSFSVRTILKRKWWSSCSATISCVQNNFRFYLSANVNGMSTNIFLVSMVSKRECETLCQKYCIICTTHALQKALSNEEAICGITCVQTDI